MIVVFWTGEIRLSIYFSQNNSLLDLSNSGEQVENACNESPSRSSSGSSSSSPKRILETTTSKDEKPSTQKTFAGRIAQMFNKSCDMPPTIPENTVDTDPSENSKDEVVDEIKTEDQSSNETFEETMRKLQSLDQDSEIPCNLPGGVLIDQMYVIAPKDLNTLLFSPDSDFLKSLADFQGTTELQVGPWKFENESRSLKRSLAYIKAPTRLVRALKAFEEQTYVNADGKNFAVLANISTPDAPYGSTFKVEILFVITPGHEMPSGEQCSHLVISWRMNFLQSTMMKSMIENGARQGMKDNYDQFANLLSQTVKPVDSKDLGSSKEQALASIQAEPQSDWKLAVQFFCNFTVVLTFFMAIYVLVHIWMAAPSKVQGLEFDELDLPDSVGDFVVCAVLVLHVQRVLGLISRFMQARAQNGNSITSFPFVCDI